MDETVDFEKQPQAFLREVRWLYRSLMGRAFGIRPLLQRSPRVIVSLTAIPERIPKLFITLESLLRQKEKPDAIILWLPQTMASLKMPWLIRRQQRRGVTIRFCDDLGSYKKLYDALKENPGDIIVTCDDDVIYPQNWLEGLLTTHREDPQSIICYRAREMCFDEKGSLRKYETWKFSGPDRSAASHFLFATGMAGILYPPGALPPTFFDKTLFLRLCPTADDVWIKAMALLQKTLVRKATPRFEPSHFPILQGSQKVTLWADNLGGGGNDTQIKNVFSYFKLEEFLKKQRD